AMEYSKDYRNLSMRKDLKFLPKDSSVPTMAFRIQTERFKQGMKDLVANTQGTTKLAVDNAKKLEPNDVRLAAEMAKYNNIQNELRVFRKSVTTLARKAAVRHPRGRGRESDPATLAPGAAAAKDDDKQ